MIIRKEQDAVALESETTLVFSRLGFDGYSLETSDYTGYQKFVISEREREVHALFEKLFENVFIQYVNTGECRMQKVSYKPYCLILKSDSDLDNSVTIELVPDTGDIVLWFCNAPDNHFHNNRVLLDIDGNLYGGYYAAFRELFEGLQNLPSKEPGTLTRFRNFLTNKKHK